MMSGFRGLSHSFIIVELISPNSESTGCKGFLFITSNLLLQIAYDSVSAGKKSVRVSNQQCCSQQSASSAPIKVQKVKLLIKFHAFLPFLFCRAWMRQQPQHETIISLVSINNNKYAKKPLFLLLSV